MEWVCGVGFRRVISLIQHFSVIQFAAVNVAVHVTT
jgi:hypothetical protein